jgi:hypothetical protein
MVVCGRIPTIGGGCIKRCALATLARTSEQPSRFMRAACADEKIALAMSVRPVRNRH